jgi:hypothetical protein
MKNIILYSAFVLFIVSCDPVTYVTYNINNSTNRSLIFFFHSNVAVENDTLTINRETSITWRTVSVSGRSPEKIDLNQYYDSIIVKSGKLIEKKYTPDLSGKNIYNYEFWTENKKGKRDYEYTFEITDDDIANCERQ